MPVIQPWNVRRRSGICSASARECEDQSAP